MQKVKFAPATKNTRILETFCVYLDDRGHDDAYAIDENDIDELHEILRLTRAASGIRSALFIGEHWMRRDDLEAAARAAFCLMQSTIESWGNSEPTDFLDDRPFAEIADMASIIEDFRDTLREYPLVVD